jgi:hypothetical protein
MGRDVLLSITGIALVVVSGIATLITWISAKQAADVSAWEVVRGMLDHLKHDRFRSRKRARSRQG